MRGTESALRDASLLREPASTIECLAVDEEDRICTFCRRVGIRILYMLVIWGCDSNVAVRYGEKLGTARTGTEPVAGWGGVHKHVRVDFATSSTYTVANVVSGAAGVGDNFGVLEIS